MVMLLGGILMVKTGVSDHQQSAGVGGHTVERTKNRRRGLTWTALVILLAIDSFHRVDFTKPLYYRLPLIML